MKNVFIVLLFCLCIGETAMAKVARTEIVDIDINKLFAVITDYAKYPEFVEGVSGIKVLSQSESNAQVEYALNLIKSFKYIINTKSEKPSSVSWELDSGDLFKKNTGAWDLKDLGNGKVEVTYSLDVEFKLFAPNSILSALTEKNLPSMMQAFFKRAREL